MGHTSKELKDIVKRAKEKEGKAEKPEKKYYLLKVMRGKQGPPGWVGKANKRTYFDDLTAESYLTEKPRAEAATCGVFSPYQWFLYPGPPPNPKWGPVCP